MAGFKGAGKIGDGCLSRKYGAGSRIETFLMQ
jgi:hypothetical protein